MTVKKGQVLWLKLRFGQTDKISPVYHPYLILGFTKQDVQLVEIGQMDSKKDNPWTLARGTDVVVDNINPDETVIYVASYLQTDRKILIEYFDDLSHYLDTTDTLSEKKLEKVINRYYDLRQKHETDDFRNMRFSESEVKKLNPIRDWKKECRKRKTKVVTK